MSTLSTRTALVATVAVASAVGLAWYLSTKQKRKYRYVACDMDGTLLGSDGKLAARTIKTLRELSARGVTVIIASGRDRGAIMPHVLELELAQAFVPIVSYNGSYCFLTDGVTTTELFRAGIDKGSAMKVVNYAERIGCTVQWYDPIKTQIFAVNKSDDHTECLERYAELVGHGQTMLESFDHFQHLDEPCKMLLLRSVKSGGADSILEQMRSGEHEFDLTSHHVIRGSPEPFFLEFLKPGVNKGNGLIRVCTHLGIDLEDVIAFGDGDNDAEFLQLVGLGYAMKNAGDLAKTSANVTLDYTNDEHGVARTLDDLVRLDLL
eukprot:m.142228 g.142228  ORF g.142228 m.142228 type:complete len:321 (-) comp30238_c0_seq2:68-1030(-)